MPSIKIKWEADLRVAVPTRYRVSRKANTTTPLHSWAENEFVELAEVTGSPLLSEYTDNEGDADYWYRIETGDADGYYPPAHAVPGHGNYSFGRLRVGVGWMSNFMPGSIGSALATEARILYDAELQATWYLLNQYLRGKYQDHTIFEEFFKDPPPAVRKITELLAAIELMAQFKPMLEDELAAMQKELDRALRAFTSKKRVMMGDIVPQSDDKLDPARPSIGWDR